MTWNWCDLEIVRLTVTLRPDAPKRERPRPDDLDMRWPDGTPWLGRPISPSQLSLADACERKWGFQYLDNRRTPPTKAQQLGVDMHAQLDAWLTHGVAPDNMRFINSNALRHFPAPKTAGMKTEQVFVFLVRRPGGEWIGFWGFKDVEFGPAVWDLKTTSSLDWAKTEEELRNDIQGIIYALDAMLAADSLEAFLWWVYVQTTGASVSRPTEATITMEHALTEMAEHWISVAERVIQNRDLRSKNTLTTLSLLPNPSACGAYGGCPFVGECGQPSGMDLLVSLHGQEQIQQTRAPAQTPTEPDRMPNITDKIRELQARKAAESGAAPAVAAPVVPPVAVATVQVATTPAVSTTQSSGGPVDALARLRAASKGSVVGAAAAPVVTVAAAVPPVTPVAAAPAEVAPAAAAVVTTPAVAPVTTPVTTPAAAAPAAAADPVLTARPARAPKEAKPHYRRKAEVTGFMLVRGRHVAGTEVRRAQDLVNAARKKLVDLGAAADEIADMLPGFLATEVLENRPDGLYVTDDYIEDEYMRVLAAAADITIGL